MRIEELKRAKEQWPFRPLWIHMAAGRADTSPADKWKLIDIALVTSLSGAPAQPAAGDRGDMA